MCLFVFNFPLEIFGSLGFVLCRGAGGDLPVATRPQGGAAADCPSLLSKLRLFRAGSRDRLSHRGRLGTCFPGLGRALQNLASRGRVRTLFLLSAEGQSGQPAYPPPVPLVPRLLPLSSVGPRQRGAGAAFPCPDSSAHALYPSLRRRRAPCARKPPQIRPREGPGAHSPSSGGAGGPWVPFWAACSALQGCGGTPPVRPRTPRCAPLPSPQLERRD